WRQGSWNQGGWDKAPILAGPGWGELARCGMTSLSGFACAVFFGSRMGVGVWRHGWRGWVTAAAVAGRPWRVLSPGIRLAAYSSSFTYAQRPPGHDGAWLRGGGADRATVGRLRWDGDGGLESCVEGLWVALL